MNIFLHFFLKENRFNLHKTKIQKLQSDNTWMCLLIPFIQILKQTRKYKLQFQ